MTRILFTGTLFAILLTTSCQKCISCSYTYTKIDIESTPNGEIEVESTVSGNLEDGDFTTTREQECVKGSESFTIESAYELEAATTDKLNF
ncbi:MAG: hypothetical protein R3279_07900 [Putridiphycobacter sp.]|nr:hypothetical protein [Putridiphycobacter sp.]